MKLGSIALAAMTLFALEAVTKTASAQFNCNPNLAGGSPFGTQYPFGGVSLPDGPASFADHVVMFAYGLSNPPIAEFADPCSATGVPDYSKIPGSGHSAHGATGSVALGEGGILVVGFTDNLLTNSGDAQPDLYVFETGNVPERFEVALRAADAHTQQLMDWVGTDLYGDGFFDLPGSALPAVGFVTLVDLDGVFPGYSAGELRFDTVWLRDDLTQGPFTSENPGADIDAVGALQFAQSQPPCGRALHFDGSDIVVSHADFDLTQFTVEGWTYPMGYNAWYCPCGGLLAWGYDGNSSWELSLGPPSGLGFDSVRLGCAINWNKSFQNSASTEAKVGSVGWRHWAWSYDGTTSRLYIDGSLEHEANWAAPVLPSGVGATFAIGSNFPGADENLIGDVDEVRIWSVVRTEQEIRDTMSVPLAGTEPGLFAYYAFEEGGGQVVHDLSGNGRDAFLGGSEYSEGSDPVWIASTAPLKCPWSYGTGGGAIPGSDGKPFLHGVGDFAAGSSGAVRMDFAAPNALALMFVATPTSGLMSTPFKGGILWAVPVSLKLLLVTSATGTGSFAYSSWPAGVPSGLLIAMQCAVIDSAAVHGVSLSNLLLAETP